MAQVGLTDRLNQHAQRTGPVLGCAMALVLLVCMGTGIVLYQRLEEYRTDIFGVPTVVQSVATVPPAATKPSGTPSISATTVAARPGGEAGAAAPTPVEEPTPTAPPAPRFRIINTGNENLNVRAEATTQSQVLARLPPGSVVEDAGEEQEGTAGAQRVTWRKIKTSTGQVGWAPASFLERVGG